MLTIAELNIWHNLRLSIKTNKQKPVPTLSVRQWKSLKLTAETHKMIGIIIIFEKERKEEELSFNKPLQSTYINSFISDNNREDRSAILKMWKLRLRKTVICPRSKKCLNGKARSV